jgi:hypothetical protein
VLGVAFGGGAVLQTEPLDLAQTEGLRTLNSAVKHPRISLSTNKVVQANNTPTGNAISGRSTVKEILALVLTAAFLTAGPVLSQESVGISFAPGATSTTINGSVVGDEYIDYVVNARSGQTMVVSLAVTGTNGNGSAMFNIVPAGQDFPAIYNGSNDDHNRAEVVLPEGGDWAIRVYLMGNDRDTGKTVGYSIDVYIAPGGSSDVSTSRVTGLAGGDLLNVRSGPGTNNPVVGQLGNGDRVRRLGCQLNGNTEWCEIEMMTDMRERGWVSARYLSGDGASAPAASGDTTSEERVRFAPGTNGAELTGQLVQGASRRYVLGASDGQNLYFRLAANGPGMFYQIFNPDGSFLLDQMTADREYRGQLWQSGDHVIEVINRGNGAQSYNVIFSIE